MSQLRSLPFVVAIGLALAACQAPAGQATLRVRPQLDGPARHVLTTAHTATSIDHLDVRLSRIEGGLPVVVAEVEVAGSALGATLTFGNLWLNAAYRVQAVAYADAAEQMVISEETGSSVDFLVGQSEMLSPVTLPVKLKGQAVTVPGTTGATGITVVPGVYVTPTPITTPSYYMPPTDPCDPAYPDYPFSCDGIL